MLHTICRLINFQKLAVNFIWRNFNWCMTTNRQPKSSSYQHQHQQHSKSPSPSSDLSILVLFIMLSSKLTSTHAKNNIHVILHKYRSSPHPTCGELFIVQRTAYVQYLQSEILWWIHLTYCLVCVSRYQKGNGGLVGWCGFDGYFECEWWYGSNAFLR